MAARTDTEPEVREAGAGVPVLLALLVLAAAVLRFAGLGAQSLWSDELSSWEQSHRESLAEVIEKGVRPTPYPPGYQILLYGVMRTAGDSEIALRAPSAVAGVLAVLAVFFLARQLYSAREGLVSAALLAISYQAIYYSQEARAYSSVLLFAILASHFWFRVQRALEARRAPTAGALAGYLASACVLAYLHYFGLLLVAVQLAGLTALSLTRPRALAWAVGIGAAVFAAYVPWLPYLFEELGLAEIYIEEPGLHTVFGYWRFLFYDPTGALAWLAALLLAAAAARAVAERGGPGPRPGARAFWTSPTVLLVAWLVVPFAIAFVRSVLALPMITNRNLIISLPAAILLVARAVTFGLRDVRAQAATVGALAALVVFGMGVLLDYYRAPRKEQFREAAAVVAEREDEFPDARVVAHAWSKAKFDYYLERLGAEARVDVKAGTAADLPRVRAWLDREQPRHVWFLLGHMQPDRTFIEALDRDLELVFHVGLHKAFVRLYRSRPLADPSPPETQEPRRQGADGAPDVPGSKP